MANIAHTHVDWFLFSPIIKPNVIGKLQGLQSNYEITNEKLYRMTLIFPNIIAIAIIIFFVILYIVLIIIMWRNNYWNVISHTEILISNDILKILLLALFTILPLRISGIVGLILLGLTFINTILCHRNFVKFNPIMDKEFEYSNDLDDDDDDDDEEDEKDEKFSEKLNRYWKLIKKSFYDAYIFLVE
ncbi:hypothetical protein RclHR1_23120003 [Rhizophagus clarus]|uniref:Uncharacterized protein n=1 Tax=Rhizophagus clarus TaxID=94130 RepID=A0A2Z6QV95_9GLOM|nr:hypothetical protein RclHR1_23120003 [Rhizophagus clarus]